MSIPGLGQIAPLQPTTSTTRTITLRPFWEWRFEVPRSSSSGSAANTNTSGGGGATVRLTSGAAERDGTELALNRVYTFPRNTQSKLLTYTGATLEVSGAFVDRVAQYPSPEASPQLPVLNLHFALQELRTAAGAGSGNKDGGINGGGGGGGARPPGPRVMICGEKDSGKTTVARTLAALATRAGGQPLVGSVDPREGMLALPGTISAAVFGTVMDVEDPAAGFGVSGTPSSGPSAVPVKLPMVYYVGREKADEDVSLWRDLVGKLGSSVRAKFAADEVVREAGLLLDTPAASVAKGDLEVLTHAVNEFAVNIVAVLGSVELHAELQRRFENARTVHGEPITLILLDKSDGVAERDKDFMKFTREAAIKEYFFGDAKRTLSPFTQSVGFDDVAVFRTPEATGFYDTRPALERAEISAEMSHWTLAVMNASVNDPPEVIRQAPVMGFVAIADVDEDRRRLKVLSPVSGRLGNRPMVWGRWPEPYINLLG
ncbi:Pre-mRNA cleavage complex II protein Clp1-domain-containing protein [Chaetomium sp. MPI-CAGE-AT-0009]|nr:Pre-mRNA cleavage complex II protein Clp1-domain-containing protein [Chaetomium sp. MPI-CAGE-AT-0009]